MEKVDNQNIQYRRLRDPKRGKVGRFSTSLLGKHEKDKSSSEKKKNNTEIDSEKIAKKNMGLYEHLIKNPMLHLKDIDWVSKLRQPIVIKENKEDQVEFVVPSAFSKTTQARNKHLEKTPHKERCYNTADFHGIISRKQNNRHLQPGILSYITNLRVYPQEIKTQKVPQKQNQGEEKSPNKQNQSAKINNRQRSAFSTIPFKQRNQYPKFLTKDSLKKVKNFTDNQFESAFDGCQNYPIFSQKINKQRNYGVFNSFIHGPSKPSFPTLAWQMGLRK